jgi:hypothetical protein
MTANRQIFEEHEKTNLDAVIDAIKLISLESSTRETEPLSKHIIDNNYYNKKIQGTPKSAHINNRCQHTDNCINHDPNIAEYKNADLNRRLQMYLQFPILKSEFDLINKSARYLNKSSDFELRIISFATQMGMALGSAMGCRGPVT